MRGKRHQSLADDAWGRLGVSRMLRTNHVRRCIQCKELGDMMACADDDEYVTRAVEAIRRHAEEEPSPDNVPCHYSGCVHHEELPRNLALKMVSLGNVKVWRDIRGVQVSAIPLAVKEDDAPEGWDPRAARSDATWRHFKELAVTAGDIYVRLGPMKTMAHVWISPPYATRHESIEDPATIEDVVATIKANGTALKAWCAKKFEDLKALAHMDIGLEK